MNVPDISLLKNKKVRNAWEHHDERLDKELLSTGQKMKLSEVYVSVKEPNPDTLILRRFDPINKVIYCFGEAIELHPCTIEVDILVKRINLAFKNLNSAENV